MNILYLGGVACDLPPTRVGLTITSDVLKEVIVSYSSRIKLPRTPINEAIMGAWFNVPSQGTEVYSPIPARYVEGGLEIIPEGYAIVNSADDEGYELVIYDSVIDLFTSIKGLKVSELNYLAASSWQASAIDSKRLATSGLVTVVLNWGKAGSIYQFNYFLPCFYYHDMVTSVLESTGLTLDGDILTDDNFLELVIPYGRSSWEYPESYGRPFHYDISLDASYNLVLTAFTPYDIVYDKLTGNGFFLPEQDYYNPSTGRFTFPDIGVSGDYMNVAIEVTFGFDINSWPVPGDSFTVALVVNGSEVVTAGIDDGTYPVGTGYSVTLTTYEDIFKAGDVFYVRINSATTTGVDINVREWAASAPDSLIGFKLTTPTLLDRDSVNWNAVLPDLSQETLIKDFIARFGIVFRQKNGVLYLRTVEEIISGGEFVDWTSKRVKDNTSINFDDSYGQSNEFIYNDLADAPDLGMGSFSIPNTVLKETRTILSSPFGNALTTEADGGNKAYIPVYDVDSTAIDEFAESPNLRLLTIRDKETAEGTISFVGGSPRTDYKVGYFVDPAQVKDTGFQYFIDTYYASLSTSLQRSKVVKRFYYLTPTDIANFDPFKMIRDGDAYYILPKIKYKPGEASEVTMTRV